jgi:hypothetical protein
LGFNFASASALSLRNGGRGQDSAQEGYAQNAHRWSNSHDVLKAMPAEMPDPFILLPTKDPVCAIEH